MYWFDYLIVPNTLLNTCWLAIGLTFPSATSNAIWANVMLLMFAIIAIVFNFVQVVLFIRQAVAKKSTRKRKKTEKFLSKRALTFLRMLDVYLAQSFGFGGLFTALQLLDSKQFITPNAELVTSNPWVLAVRLIPLTYLMFGGVGFGKYIPNSDPSIQFAALSNISGWLYTLISGSVVVGRVVKDIQKRSIVTE